jgi:hypothetical protein
MQLNSSAFIEGSTIPQRYTGDGENISPPLSWSGSPSGTKSFALICDDPDAPGKTWSHWAMYDIPPERLALGQHVPRCDATSGPYQARNDFHRPGYDGPCPPRGHGAHRYRFRLFALSVDHLKLDAPCSCAAVVKAAEKHKLAVAQLTGLYAR